MKPPIDIDFGKFVSLVRAGLSFSEIAQELYIGTATLSRWMKRNGISLYRNVEDYHMMQKYGYSDKEIARKWGISKPALYDWKKRAGLIEVTNK